MIAEFKQLKVGDVRKDRDEVRQKWVPVPRPKNESTVPPNFGEWEPIKLFSWPILPADLFNAEFRRPLL